MKITKSELRTIIKEELKEYSYWYQNVEKWDNLIKKMPTTLKQAILDIETGKKDKYSERLPTMDASGKNYIYPNVKGKPRTNWNSEVKSLLGTDLFGFYLYYKKT